MLAAIVGLSLALARLGAPEATATEASPTPPQGPGTRTPAQKLVAAKAEVLAARTAAGQGRYLVAVQHFEAALALHPLPQLHYNIAVCHHRRMIVAAPQSQTRAEAQAAAVAAYEQYLALVPNAPDRAKIEADIVALGGRPPRTTSSDWTPSLIRPDDDPAPPSLDDLRIWEDDEPPPPSTSPPSGPAEADAAASTVLVGAGPTPEPSKIRPPRVSLGVFIPIVFANPVASAQSAELSAAPMLGLGLRAGGFLGEKHRISLGGEASLVAQPLDSRQRHTLRGGWLALTVRYGHPLGDRFEMGGGGLVAGTGQTLRYNGDMPYRCGARDSGAISQRNGLLLGGRFVFAALLGKTRRHALMARVTPGLALLGPGTASQDEGDAAQGVPPCRELPTAFSQLGLRAGPSFVVTADFGYAVRL